MLRRATLTSEMKCQAFLAENVNMTAFWVVTTVLLLTFRRCVLSNLKMETEYHLEMSAAIY